MIPLESLTPCFQGLIPAWLFTCSRDGSPNVAILSHVDYVDSRHVALSFQFFNKSRRNIEENPRAMVRLYDPDTLQAYALTLRYVRTETTGPLFARMHLRIEAIASHFGLKGIFRLRGADVYEVHEVRRLPHEIGLSAGRPAAAAAPPPAELPFSMNALRDLSDRLRQAGDIDALLDGLLETLERIFGFRHSMILLTSERPDRLALIASRGYPEGGVGSEVGFGEGVIGMAAESRQPVRISGMIRHMLYAQAVAASARERGLCPDRREIPLPGLADPETQLAVPLLAHDELVGVLCIETDSVYRFHEQDRSYLEILGGYIALAVQNALMRERAEVPDDRAARPAAPAVPARDGKSVAVDFYGADECILVDGEYLIRGLPARILWKLLREVEAEPGIEFTNRRLRLDKSLDLPAFKDNLESRLILLRRRLEERCPEIRIVPSGRGRFRVALTAALRLTERS